MDKPFPTFAIKVPVKCIVCGKAADSASLMHRIDLSTFNVDMLAKVQGKYLGLYICEMWKDCYKEIMKK